MSGYVYCFQFGMSESDDISVVQVFAQWYRFFLQLKTKLEAIHVPGHSPGSLVYYCKEDNCMFSGDVLFQGSIGRADLTGGNFDELIEHICSRLFVLPNETVVYPGHGAPTTIGMEKAENPFFR